MTATVVMTSAALFKKKLPYFFLKFFWRNEIRVALGLHICKDTNRSYIWASLHPAEEHLSGFWGRLFMQCFFVLSVSRSFTKTSGRLHCGLVFGFFKFTLLLQWFRNSQKKAQKLHKNVHRDAVRINWSFHIMFFHITFVSQGINDINANSSKSGFWFFALSQSFGVCSAAPLCMIQLYSMGYVTGTRLCAARYSLIDGHW